MPDIVSDQQAAAEGGSTALRKVRLSLPQVSLQQSGSIAKYYPDAQWPFGAGDHVAATKWQRHLYYAPI